MYKYTIMFVNSSSYMKGRCMLYEQKLSVSPIEGNKYFKSDISGVALPSNDPKGSQSRSSIGCYNNKCNVAIYKPNNDQFAKQGAVSCSTYSIYNTTKTIEKNLASLIRADFASAAKIYTQNNTIPEIPFISLIFVTYCKNISSLEVKYDLAGICCKMARGPASIRRGTARWPACCATSPTGSSDTIC